MVCGSGMNGRSRESRSGGQPVKKHSPSHSQKQPHKPTASAEAIQMARILEDSKQMSEINSKVQKVLAVVPGCSEEQVHLALHDNGYDLDKTISALLDSDGQTDQGEWTTTTSSRKGRKKMASTESEESSHHKVGFGRSNRTASNSTRDNYGGSVSVHNTRENYGSGGSGGGGGGGASGHSNTGTGRNRTQGGRSKGQSANRRARVGGAAGEQRPRGRTRDKDRSHGVTSSTVQATAGPVVDEEWDIVDEVPQATTAITSAVTSQAWATADAWTTPITDHNDSKQYWEPAQQHMDSVPHEIDTEPHSVFPEAIPGQAGQERLLGQYSMAGEEREIETHSTPSEITPSLASTSGGDRDTATRHTSLESREKVTRKPKRLARSQIPTKPVEMPGGIDSLDVQFGELGIDFIGLESASPPPPSKEDTPVTGILSYSDLQPSRFGESSVSVSTSSTSTALGSEAGANVLPVENSTCMPSAEAQSERELSGSGGLRSPPGLPHPSTSTSDQAQVQPQAQLESTSTLASDVSVTQKTSSDGQLRLDDVPASSGVLKSMSIDLPMELPSNTPQTAAIEVISQQPSSYTSVTSAGSVFSTSSNVTAATPVSNLSSTSSSRSNTASHISTQHSQQHVTQQGKPSTSSVPPGMQLYPHMLPAQYPFIPAPAMYNYDPSDMSRYSSGSMAYFPTSTDPTMGGAMPSRDHTSSSYQAASDHTKFPRGGADIGTAVAVSSTQQSQQGTSLQGQGQQQQQPGGGAGGAGQQPSSGQQMGPAFMGAPFYGSMFYPTMYGPMPAFSQAANFGMAYEDMVAAQTTHDYSKLYVGGAGSTLNKPSSLPVSSSGGLDSAALAGSTGSTSFKHQLDSGKSYNYNVPAGVGGSQAPGYYMQMPHFPHMMVGPGAGDVGAMSTPHSRMTQQKHSNKVGGYQGSSGGSYWSSPAANHSS